MFLAEQELAGIRLVDARHDLEKSGLASPVLTYDRLDLAGLEGDRHVGQYRRPVEGLGKGAAEIATTERRPLRKGGGSTVVPQLAARPGSVPCERSRRSYLPACHRQCCWKAVPRSVMVNSAHRKRFSRIANPNTPSKR